MTEERFFFSSSSFRRTLREIRRRSIKCIAFVQPVVRKLFSLMFANHRCVYRQVVHHIFKIVKRFTRKKLINTRDSAWITTLRFGIFNARRKVCRIKIPQSRYSDFKPWNYKKKNVGFYNTKHSGNLNSVKLNPRKWPIAR